VVLAAETEGMVKEVESFSGLPGVLFPHPVVMPEAAEQPIAEDGYDHKIHEAHKNEEKDFTKEDTESMEGAAGLRLPSQAGDAVSNPFTSELAWDSENISLSRSASLPAYFPATSYPQPATSTKPIVVVAPGLARYEKGSDMFQDAIKLVLKNEANSAPIRFVMQWMEDFDLPDGRRCGPDPELLHDDRIEFANELLTGNAYLDFLRRADLIVLPYRSESYRVRVSRVAIEAAILGKPLVYTEATWTREVGAMVGSGVAVGVESAAALAEALREALPRLAHLQAGAVKGASRVRDFYSVRRFRVNLTEEA
jgi:glycosyltransferase involved in cell wall biosynthesis